MICGIARAAQALAPRVALSFLFTSIIRPEGSRRVGFLSEPEAKIFNLAMAQIICKHDVISINRA
jgi:hypothetical protein